MHNSIDTQPIIRPALRTPWGPNSYNLEHTVKRGAAWKLSDSGVAPLVAQARGYSVVTTKEEAKATAQRERTSLTTLVASRFIEKSLHGGLDDVLVMPWHSIASVAEDGTSARPTLSQFRPSTPDVDERTGKARKYLSLPGADFKLDVHPSTPASWLTGGDDVLLIEGLLKGDSVLSAQLLETYGADKLSVRETQDQARQDLHDLMEGMPARVRVLVVSAASVTMWERPDELREIAMKGRRAFVAFDGDLSVNPMVWKQASRAQTFLSRRTGSTTYAIALWDTAVEVAKLAAGIDPEAKVGMDEYLTRIGSFYGDLMDPERGLITGTLPAEPQAEPDHKVGDWRVRKDCPAIVEELIASVLPDGTKGAPRWEVRSHIGLEILEVRSTRLPEDEEMRTGRIIEGADAQSIEEIVARFHVLPHDGDAEFDEVETHEVRMPAAALAASRDGDWASLIRAGAMRLPASVLAHPHYPPRDMKAWLSAAKAASQVESTHGWATMGWVPTGEAAGFMTGTQVVAGTTAEEARTARGLTSRVRPRVTAWGVTDVYRDGTHADWERAVLADIREAVRLWFGAFKPERQREAAIAWAMMLRPTIPLRGRYGTVCMLSGTEGSGKSWIASLIMSGYEAYPGAWRQLPGTASDTIPSTELALSQTPLWVMDDLAPTMDAVKGASRQSTVEELIRSVFNKSARGRMGDFAVPDPRAHLIVTAENVPTTPSIRSRSWELDLTGGVLTEQGLKDLEAAMADGLFARVVGHAIRGWVSGEPRRGTRDWAELMSVAQEQYDNAEDTVTQAVEAAGASKVRNIKRHSEKAWSLIAPVYGLALTYVAALENGGSSRSTDEAYEMLEETIPELLIDHALSAATMHAGSTPGRLALKAMAQMLEAGQAHLLNPVSPAHPPLTTDAERVAAGWQMRGTTWVPQGIALGTLGVTVEGETVAILSGAAFPAASKAYPGLIPSGSTSAAAWRSLDGEPTLAPAGATPTQKRIRPEESAGAGDRVRGVVILWEAMQDLLD